MLAVEHGARVLRHQVLELRTVGQLETVVEQAGQEACGGGKGCDWRPEEQQGMLGRWQRMAESSEVGRIDVVWRVLKMVMRGPLLLVG